MRVMLVTWLATRLSCKSKPPTDTKNTWRLVLRLVRAAIKRATIFNCAANWLLLGMAANAAKSPVLAAAAAAVPLIPLLTVPSAAIERWVTRLYSFSSTSLRVCCTSWRITSFTADEPKTLSLTLLILTAPRGLTW